MFQYAVQRRFVDASEARRIPYRPEKNHRNRYLSTEERVLSLPPLTMQAMVDCGENGGSDGGLIFQVVEPRKHCEATLKAAGIWDFRFHDLRRSAASYLVMGVATLYEVGEVLGHRSVQTTKRYAHFPVSHKQRLTGRLLGDIHTP